MARRNPLAGKLGPTMQIDPGFHINSSFPPSVRPTDPGSNLPPSAAPPSFLPGQTYSFRLKIDGRTAGLYSAQADAAQTDPEDIMEARLRTCVAHSATKGLYFGDEDRIELETLLSSNFSTPGDALRKVRQLVTATDSESGIDIALTPQQLDRLRSRNVAGVALSDMIRRIVHRAVNEEVGLG